MAQDILDPLEEYKNVYRDRFAKVAAETFDALAAEANVDEEANRDTCRKANALTRQADSLQPAISRWYTWRFFLWLAVVAAVVCGIWLYDEASNGAQLIIGDGSPHLERGGYAQQSSAGATAMDYNMLSGIALCAVVALLLLVYIFARVNRKLRSLRSREDELRRKASALVDKAWAQMEPLNRLYDSEIFARMTTATVPRLEFDPFVSEQRLEDLRRVYNWDDAFSEGRSVLCSLSGLINGNPFVFCRTKRMEWGSRTYYGHLTIYWTVTVRDSEGRYHTEQRSETLTASVTKPYPEFISASRLIYGNTAAPDLEFSRIHSGLAGNENSRQFRRARRRLRRKTRDLKGSDYAMLSNEEFEVAFDTSDRNNNQQHALLFTPLAQQNLMKLMADTEVGYGDDFDFYKRRMINTVCAAHLNAADIDMDARRYRNYDFEKARRGFIDINAEAFRSIYFTMAPLLCIPMYQQIRPREAIYGSGSRPRSSFWEHEALANFWGNDFFKHPQCVTDCILKTRESRGDDGRAALEVTAYGYSCTQRLTFVSVFGGDGHFHEVPVYWDEYSEVTGTGKIDMQEDGSADSFSSQGERISHINDFLSGGYSLYRRHIASRCR